MPGSGTSIAAEVGLHREVVARLGGGDNAVEGAVGAEVGRGEVLVAESDEHAEVGVLHHCVGELVGEVEVMALGVSPREAGEDVVAPGGFISEVGFEVGVAGGGVGALVGGVRRVELGGGGCGVGVEAGDGSVEPADELSLVGEEGFEEPAGGNAKVVLDDEFLGQAGLGGELFGEGGAVGIGEGSASGEGLPVVAGGEGFDFGEEGGRGLSVGIFLWWWAVAA